MSIQRLRRPLQKRPPCWPYHSEYTFSLFNSRKYTFFRVRRPSTLLRFDGLEACVKALAFSRCVMGHCVNTVSPTWSAVDR